jgi:hypothetical protein
LRHDLAALSGNSFECPGSRSGARKKEGSTMIRKPRWMKSAIKTAQSDLPPLPFARSEVRHDLSAEAQTKM